MEISFCHSFHKVDLSLTDPSSTANKHARSAAANKVKVEHFQWDKESISDDGIKEEDESRRIINEQPVLLIRNESLAKKQEILPENQDEAAFKQKVIDALIRRTTEDEKEVRNL